MQVLRWFFQQKPPDNSEFKTPVPSIPYPEGWPGNGRISRPKKRGKTAQEYEKEYDEYVVRVEKQKRAIAAFDRAQAIKAGAVKYVWRGLQSTECGICLKRSGKVYSYDKPTQDGYPGEGSCGNKEFCHAWAKPVI